MDSFKNSRGQRRGNNSSSNLSGRWNTNTKPNQVPVVPKKKEYHYAVNLRLDPVELGITCRSTPGHRHTFTGLGAFNFYFDYLLPYADGFSLPDIWDGYFHITLGKFTLPASNQDDPYQVEKRLASDIRGLRESTEHYGTFFPCQFNTEQLSVHDGTHRFGDQQGIDFVALAVNDPNGIWTRLEPLLQIIQTNVENVGGQWERAIEDYRTRLHVTVRKYQGEHGRWSQQYINNSGILQRVLQSPLSFDCVALEIAPSRRDAALKEGQWWIGVTGIGLPCPRCERKYSDDLPGYCPVCNLYGDDHECSGCHRRETRRRKWQGFCPGCWEYERLEPVWSTAQ